MALAIATTGCHSAPVQEVLNDTPVNGTIAETMNYLKARFYNACVKGSEPLEPIRDARKILIPRASTATFYCNSGQPRIDDGFSEPETIWAQTTKIKEPDDIKAKKMEAAYQLTSSSRDFRRACTNDWNLQPFVEARNQALQVLNAELTAPGDKRLYAVKDPNGALRIQKGPLENGQKVAWICHSKTKVATVTTDVKPN